MLKIIKVLFISFCIMQICPSFAVDACVEDDTVAIVLDATVKPTAFQPGNPDGGFKWSVTVPGTGIVQGISACTMFNGYKNHVRQFEPYIANNGVLIDNGKVVVGGEQNGEGCWCKTVYPITSLWVLRDHGTGNCSRNCANWCAYVMYLDLSDANAFRFRRNLYNGM